MRALKAPSPSTETGHTGETRPQYRSLEEGVAIWELENVTKEGILEPSLEGGTQI